MKLHNITIRCESKDIQTSIDYLLKKNINKVWNQQKKKFKN